MVVKALHLFPVNYFNRKGFYSIVLQAVVDHKKKFLDICVGWPGSTHDSRILTNSNLYNKFNNQNNLVTTFFNNKYILDDGGYPNLSWLIVLYKNIGIEGHLFSRKNFLILCKSIKKEKIIALNHIVLPICLPLSRGCFISLFI